MNILGLVFPASLFQQTDQHTSLERNDLRTKCVADTFRPTREASQVIKNQEDSSDYGCSKKSSGDRDVCSRELIDVSKASGNPLTLSHDERAKKTSKKKKRRKGKSNNLHLDNNIASETVHVSKISPSTGLVECNLTDSKVCNEIAREVIGKSVHDKVDAKLDGTSSESALNSIGSNHFLNSADTECVTTINKLSLEITAFQDPASGNKNIDGTCDTNFASNQERNEEAAQGSSIITSVTALESRSVSFKDAKNNDTKPASTLSSSLENSNPVGAQIAPGNANCRSTEICEKGSNGVSFEEERSDTQNEITADINFCRMGSNMESPCSRSLLEDSRACCHDNLRPSSGVNEADKYESRKDVKSSNQSEKISDIPKAVQIHSLGLKQADRKDNNMEVTPNNQFPGVCDVPEIELIQTSEHNEGNSQISNTTSWVPCRMKYRRNSGKENAHVTWQRTGRYIGSSQTMSRRISDHGHLCTDAASSETNFVLKHGSSKGDGLLPPPHISHYSKGSFQQKVKNSGVSKKMYKAQGHMLVDASDWATREDFHARCDQYVLRPRKDSVMGNGSWERSKNKSAPPSKQENANYVRKGLWVSKPNLCKPGTRKTLHDIKPNDEVGTTSIEGVKLDSVRVSLIEEDKSSVSSGIELPCDSTTKEVFTSRVSSPVWIPVGKRHPLMLKTSRDIEHTILAKLNRHQAVDTDALCGESIGLDITKDVHKYSCLTNGRQGNLGKDKDYCSVSDYISENLPVYICSDLAEQALKASYTLQIASESFQLARGSPIAEFEKLLYSASPVIAQQYGVVKHEALTASFIKPPKPSIALGDVWNWYEGPGNYGLQIKAEDSQNSKGLEADVSFHAHFVPFLSAIQLFGCPCHTAESFSGNINGGIPEGEVTEEHSCPSSSLEISSLELVSGTSPPDPVSSKKRIRPCGTATSHGGGCSASASSVCLCVDSHVIFEYFEHDPPQQRKPLFAKIKELFEVGNSYSQVFCDPSKLKCTDLQDLHPASWYSVAWYPIYRIPEGCFHASFLTYHSLGHLFLRCTESDSVEENTFSVVSPALGMQSYNAQGECWFHPKKPADDLLKDCERVDFSVLLKERLRSLEETAALFSRGYVLKDHITTANRHPDYEFFLSRKH